MADHRGASMRFCQECNNLLYPCEGAEHVLQYRCRICDHIEDAEDPMVYRNVVTHDAGGRTLILHDVMSDPTLPRTRTVQCPNPTCRQREAILFQNTSGRVKNAFELYFVCVHCGHRWKG